MKSRNLKSLLPLALGMTAIPGTRAAITSISETGAFPNTFALIEPRDSTNGSFFGEDAWLFSDRSHECNGVAFDGSGNLTTSGGTIVVGLPPYLVGRPYVATSNNQRTNANYALTINVDRPSLIFLLLDNRLGDSDNKTPPSLGSAGAGLMAWVADMGFVPANTGLSPNGQPDFVGIDEGNFTPIIPSDRSHLPTVGPGIGVDNFFTVYVKAIGTGSITLQSENEGNRNMYGVVIASGDTPPTIAIQPSSQTVQAAANVTFTVVASGTTPLNYQWRRNGVNIPGATSATLTRDFVSTADAGTYSVVVSNPYGSITSATAQLTVTQQLTLVPTDLVPTVAQTTPAIQGLCPVSSSHLKTFINGNFTTGITPDSTKMTVVLTHGRNSSVGDWPPNMAAVILQHLAVPTPNIVAWDWADCARSEWYDLTTAARRVPEQGRGLGQALLNALGPSYSQPIHFIGHSFGTLVNAAAADYLHGDTPKSPGRFNYLNTHMTLFDEAEVAVGLRLNRLRIVATLPTLLIAQDFSGAKPYYGEPLPKNFAWADNYVSAFGLLHSKASNIILTNGFPADATDFSTWFDAIVAFHGYPYEWYHDTVVNPSGGSMGYRWSFEQGGFTPTLPLITDSVQAYRTSPLDLVLTNHDDAKKLLDSRVQKYLKAFGSSGAQTVANGLGFGQVSGQALVTGPANGWDMIVNLQTRSSGSSPSPNSAVRPQGPGPAGPDGTNVPAYAWIPLTVPSNAVSMSCEFMLQGDGQDDSFAVALNGTNVLSLSADLIQTNITLNSGPIDVSQYSGRQVELFLGIVGGTSTNAAVTVSNFQFYSVRPPSLQAHVSGNNLIASWPLSAVGYALEASTDLSVTNSWTTVTNVPTIVGLQNTVTNSISSGGRFYRLREQ